MYRWIVNGLCWYYKGFTTVVLTRSTNLCESRNCRHRILHVIYTIFLKCVSNFLCLFTIDYKKFLFFSLCCCCLLDSFQSIFWARQFLNVCLRMLYPACCRYSWKKHGTSVLYLFFLSKQQCFTKAQILCGVPLSTYVILPPGVAALAGRDRRTDGQTWRAGVALWRRQL